MRQLKITKLITHRATESIEKYLLEISKIPLITSDREIELAKLIKTGDNKALCELINANLRFVVSVAKQYQNRGVDLIDLINEGNLGLIKGAQRFDETRGFKFISYAVWWVRQSIIDAIANNGRIIRLPLNKIGLQNKFLRATSKLEQELQRIPSDDEIMQEMQIEDAKEYNSLCENMTRVQSYDAPISDDNSISALDIMITKDNTIENPDSSLILESLKYDINSILGTLHIREKVVVESFFGLNGNVSMNLNEIAEKYGYSTERVRQIKDVAIKKFRIYTKANLMRKYLN
jgi:RNA polymerase primary sigma factor